MKYLLVIDMQEDYVGSARNKKQYPYKEEVLIDRVNQKILEYPKENVIYITNKFFYERANKTKKLVDGLMVVSDFVFEKRKSDCFSNKALLQFLQDKKVTELELVGVDGNYCVKASAKSGVLHGFAVTMYLPAVGVANQKKFEKTKQGLTKAGVKF